MPWWSWIVIWGGMVLLAVALLAWIAYRLFRKLMTAVGALGDLADQVSTLGDTVEVIDPQRFRPAIFTNRDALAQGVEADRANRLQARQLRRDRLITRGKLLQRAPVNQRTPPHA
jgi:hypothetical protein